MNSPLILHNYQEKGLWYYEPPIYTTHRFILGVPGDHPLVCFGINPSTAEPSNLDNTLKSVARIAKNNGFDSWIMFNVSSQRATNPNDMDKTLNLSLHKQNLEIIEEIFKTKRPLLWAAWGTIIEKRSYLTDYLNDIIVLSKKYNLKWVSFGPVSKAGHPHHPLYLSQHAKMDDFNIDNYLLTIQNIVPGGPINEQIIP